MLVKRGSERRKGRDQGKTIVDNRWMNLMPFSPARMDRWTAEMSVVPRRDVAGRIVGLDGADPAIYALDGLKSICSIVPEFDELKPGAQELLDNNLQYKYFNHLVSKLVGAGLSPSVGLIAAPYDFRLALDPVARAAFFNMVQRRVEAAVYATDQPAVVVAHSMGALMFAWFLATSTDEAWRTRHIAKFISINAPFGGTPLALRALFCGEYYIPGFSHVFRAGLQFNSGILMGLPNNVGYAADVPLCPGITAGDLVLDKKNEGIADIAGSLEAWRALYDPAQLALETAIPIDVVVSEGVETIATFDPTDGAVLTTTDGDGLVTAAGLNAAFELLRGPNVTRRTVEGTNHRSIVADPRFIRYVLDELHGGTYP
jgi:pimeloyl-ACP methyl ester carboxylesterase